MMFPMPRVHFHRLIMITWAAGSLLSSGVAAQDPGPDESSAEEVQVTFEPETSEMDSAPDSGLESLLPLGLAPPAPVLPKPVESPVEGDLVPAPIIVPGPRPDSNEVPIEPRTVLVRAHGRGAGEEVFQSE